MCVPNNVPSNLLAVREHLEQFYERHAIDKVRLQLLHSAVCVLEFVIGPVSEGLLLHLDPRLVAAHGSSVQLSLSLSSFEFDDYYIKMARPEGMSGE